MGSATYAIRKPETRDLLTIEAIFTSDGMVMPSLDELLADDLAPDRRGEQSSEPFTGEAAVAAGGPLGKVILLPAENGNDTTAKLSHALVAVNDDDIPIGLIRILEIADPENPTGDGAYVYPVIVYPTWQHRGVATALINAAVAEFGELKLVACKSSQGFYPKAGFEPLDWSEVAAQIAHDCELCPDLPTCDPQPFIKIQSKASSES